MKEGGSDEWLPVDTGRMARIRWEPFFLLLLLIPATTVWAYFHVMSPGRPVSDPSRGFRVKANLGEQEIEVYRRQVLTRAIAETEAVQAELLELYRSLTSGGSDGIPERERQIVEMTDRLRGTINEMKLMEVPRDFEKPHLMVAESIGETYKAVVALEDWAVEGTPVESGYRKRFNEHFKNGIKLLKKSKAHFTKIDV